MYVIKNNKIYIFIKKKTNINFSNVWVLIYINLHNQYDQLIKKIYIWQLHNGKHKMIIIMSKIDL